jgi:hypothetical protein
MSWEKTKKNFLVSNDLSNWLSTLLSKVIWRDGPMTPARNALSLLIDHLAQLSRREEGALALERFTEAGLDLACAEDLSALVQQCGPPSDGPRRAEVVGGLVPLACSDPVAAQCVVAVLRPELSRMARLLARGPLEAEEAGSEVVAIGLEVVARGQCSRRRLDEPDRVIDAIWTEARRSAGLRRRGLIEVVPLLEELEVAASDPDPLERWPGLLAAAVAHGVLTPRQVVVIAQSRMEGRPLTEVARALGRPWGAVYQERRRGEAALRRFALASSSTDSP